MGVDAQMLVKVQGEYDPEKVKYYSYIFGSAFHNWLWLDYEGHKPLMEKDRYYQDGEDIIPKKGEYFLEVPLLSRYYGRGYERGPLFHYIIMAEFLEKLIPNCQVFYGGDSSGICAEPFDKEERDSLMRYFIENQGHDNYRRKFDSKDNGPDCPNCEVQMVRNGWGPSYALYTCAGCGWIIKK